MNKAELTKTVAEKTGLSREQSQGAVSTAFAVITDALSKGEKVHVSGFGTFMTKQRAARRGVNPHTREAIDIPPVTVAAFKAGTQLKTAVRCQADSGE